jgi:hypothetical protein
LEAQWAIIVVLILNGASGWVLVVLVACLENKGCLSGLVQSQTPKIIEC